MLSHSLDSFSQGDIQWKHQLEFKKARRKCLNSLEVFKTGLKQDALHDSANYPKLPPQLSMPSPQQPLRHLSGLPAPLSSQTLLLNSSRLGCFPPSSLVLSSSLRRHACLFQASFNSSFILSSNTKPGSKASLERKEETANVLFCTFPLPPSHVLPSKSFADQLPNS